MRFVVFLIALLHFMPEAQAQDAKQQRINQAIDSAERICLVGSRFKFQVDASGNLTIAKLLPGVTGKVTIDQAQAKGSQFFEHEDVRRLVDSDIRDCMKMQWTVVLQVMDSPHAYECPRPPQQVAQDLATEVHSSSTILLTRTSGSYDNVARTVTRDLLEKYPNADQVIIRYAMLSMACQLIMGSSLSDDQKLDRLYRLEDWMWHASGRSTPVKLTDTTVCPSTTASVLAPIQALFSSWTLLDVDNYLAQWGPDAIHRSKYGVFNKATLARQRRVDFARFTRVDVLSYSPTVVFADGRKAVVNNSYEMRYSPLKGRPFTEREAENYTLECSMAEHRWMIRENNDYLPEWSK